MIWICHGILAVIFLTAAAITSRRDRINDAISTATPYEDQIITEALAHHAEQLAARRPATGMWPQGPDTCAWPPCEFEARYTCSACRPARGRHHAAPVQSFGHDVIAAKIHSLDDKKASR